MRRASILMLPGWTNSGPDHWQSHWERDHPDYQRVQQDDWNRPDRQDWLRKINEAVRQSNPPIILVAHSLGCIAAVGWTGPADSRSRSRVAGAFLVAPADTERHGAPDVLHTWRPVPLFKLPFPSVVVASRTDDSASFERSELFARAWGSSLVDAGDAGHIHTAAGYGPWPEGHRLLCNFVVRVLRKV
jgi:predicted alpha/beta hydrolase family esterase